MENQEEKRKEKSPGTDYERMTEAFNAESREAWKEQEKAGIESISFMLYLIQYISSSSKFFFSEMLFDGNIQWA